MRRNVLLMLALVVALGIGYGFGQQKATIMLNPQVAWWRVDGSRLQGTAPKRLTVMTLQYNDAVVPCVVVDTQTSATNSDTVGGASISCGWTPEAVDTIQKAHSSK